MEDPYTYYGGLNAISRYSDRLSSNKDYGSGLRDRAIEPIQIRVEETILGNIRIEAFDPVTNRKSQIHYVTRLENSLVSHAKPTPSLSLQDLILLL